MSKSTLTGFNYDKDKVVSIYKDVESNSKLVDGVVDGIVKKYSKELDEMMKYIKGVLEDTDNPPTNYELDEFVMNLPVYMYFGGAGQESLGIREDISNAYKKEIYSETYNNSDGTVGEKTAAAVLASQQEEIVTIAYQRAYKKMKLRMDMAQEVLQSIKKVISRRMAEHATTNSDTGGIQK